MGSDVRKWLSKLTDEQLATHFVRVKGWTSEPYKMNVNLAIVKDGSSSCGALEVYKRPSTR